MSAYVPDVVVKIPTHCSFCGRKMEDFVSESGKTIWRSCPKSVRPFWMIWKDLFDDRHTNYVYVGPAPKPTWRYSPWTGDKINENKESK